MISKITLSMLYVFIITVIFLYLRDRTKKRLAGEEAGK